jgi:hypothetical protein
MRAHVRRPTAAAVVANFAVVRRRIAVVSSNDRVGAIG